MTDDESKHAASQDGSLAVELGDAELIEAICNPIRKEETPEKKETLRAYGYIRVSTEEQAKSGLGMAAQRDAIERYCRVRGLKLEGFFADEAKSGRSPILSRPNGKRLDDQLAKGDQVILAKHDRGFRNVIDMLKTTENWTARGVVTHICNWALDTTQPFWKLFAPIAAALGGTCASWFQVGGRSQGRPIQEGQPAQACRRGPPGDRRHADDRAAS